jgi:enoyl-CoA hydratase
MSELQYLEVERHDGVALVRLNRPEVLNALCMGLMQELAQVFGELESDDGIAVIVMTGNDKAYRRFQEAGHRGGCGLRVGRRL